MSAADADDAAADADAADAGTSSAFPVRVLSVYPTRSLLPPLPCIADS